MQSITLVSIRLILRGLHRSRSLSISARQTTASALTVSKRQREVSRNLAIVEHRGSVPRNFVRVAAGHGNVERLTCAQISLDWGRRREPARKYRSTGEGGENRSMMRIDRRNRPVKAARDISTKLRAVTRLLPNASPCERTTEKIGKKGRAKTRAEEGAIRARTRYVGDIFRTEDEKPNPSARCFVASPFALVC